MSLESGSQLGIYTIVGPLGAGGMGEVYRATDSTLQRDVAIKVLPDATAYDRERLARFEREAKVLAQLNHPMIATIYGFDEADEKRFLVLELVEGPTLAERLVAGRLPVEESLEINRQIAEALEVAHSKGIIHRDLKPANIKVTNEGQVKVLDFGLAKALVEDDCASDPSDSQTITNDFTEPGVILGTAAYMSPEQARGRDVDRRSDIWSFGCILFECLSGDSIFRGETVTDSIGAVLHKQPDWGRLPSVTPPAIRHLLWRCLAKDRDRRLRDIADARVEIEEAIEDPNSSVFGSAHSPDAFGSKRTSRPLGLTSLIATAIIASICLWSLMRFGRDEVDTPIVKLFPSLEGLDQPNQNAHVTISPDGRNILYIRDDHVWVQNLEQLRPQQLPGTQGARWPFWSPDSRSIAYLGQQALWRVAVAGEAPIEVAMYPERFRFSVRNGGGAWTANGRIVFHLTSRGAHELLSVSAQGGEPVPFLDRIEGVHFADINPLPNGRGILGVQKQQGSADSIVVLDEGRVTTVLTTRGDSVSTPTYSASGHILYGRRTTSPTIWALPFSLKRLETTEAPFRVASGYQPSVGTDGTLVFMEGDPVSNPARRLAWTDKTGTIEPIPNSKQAEMHAISLSRDNNRALVVAKKNEEEVTRAIWLHDLVRGGALPLTFPGEGMSDHWPVWHPTGEQFFFTRIGGAASSIMMGRVDGSGEPEQVVSGTSNHSFGVSPDATRIAFSVENETRGDQDLYYVVLDGNKVRHVLRDSPAIEERPRISPDGRLLAYRSNASGTFEVYLTTFPSGEGRWPVSVVGEAYYHAWGQNASQQLLYYLDGTGNLCEVAVEFESDASEPVVGTPSRLFSISQVGGTHLFGASRSGDRILMAQQAAFGQESDKVVLVQNWFHEFANRVAP